MDSNTSKKNDLHENGSRLKISLLAFIHELPSNISIQLKSGQNKEQIAENFFQEAETLHFTDEGAEKLKSIIYKALSSINGEENDEEKIKEAITMAAKDEKCNIAHAITQVLI